MSKAKLIMLALIYEMQAYLVIRKYQYEEELSIDQQRHQGEWGNKVV